MKAKNLKPTTPRAPCYVSYARVSTARQGASGLGLDAQREAITRYVGTGRLVGEFVEVESAKGGVNRPQLIAALAACKLHRAVLVIAKLDRLSRNVAFVSALQESDVEFVACDNPHATKLMVHMLVAFAEHEREMISTRTVAALAQAKARGAKLGNPRLRPGTADTAAVARAAHVQNALEAAQRYAAPIAEAREAGATSLQAIADRLTVCGVPTPRGGNGPWQAEQVRRVLLKLAPEAMREAA
jgi:DNA invertase Pin-like site-specific DNA recombinase